MPGISTVLFDADGVVQSSDALYAWLARDHGWSAAQVDAFFQETLQTRWDYDGTVTGLAPLIAPALASRGCDVPAITFLRKWFTLGAAPDPGALALVAALRRHGTRCVLASNQDLVRARFMDEELGYERLFDDRFYSARVGYAKPDPAYFHAVVTALAADPAELLFIDDRPENVDAARDCGLHAELHRPGDRLRDTLARYRLPVPVAAE
ncbi:MAG TPA: HAD-IA family hydrolase [Natronosporangium sp.]